MLVTLKEVMEVAEKRNCGIAAINTPTFESLVAAISAAEKNTTPIIIQHAQSHEYINQIETIGPAMITLAKHASIPICAHIDHGESINYLEKGLQLGFTSIMYDGSRLPYEENVQKTRKAVRLANEFGASVEGELGIMIGNEIGEHTQEVNEEDNYTDPQLAYKFVKETNIDALAASFGTVHGFYRHKPNLDYKRIKEIATLTNLPLVMHGGSGLSSKEYKLSIKNGVKKINYYTYGAKVGADATKNCINNNDAVLFSEISRYAQDAMEKDFQQIIDVFKSITE
ncbi:class II fructose-bisphosphate aldolase [Virgibacillus dokdonensis]|uniref:Class II fructose-bisphosphate aldolase n=1 Tax=Virgibacillus dokdonensis TaxID=302167 RepID=A0ABU7VC65_9BACI|nr:class II fructose-bisphosphate aldolase [Virgibacillus dokdonensis]